jgi:hypothetical protein
MHRDAAILQGAVGKNVFVVGKGFGPGIEVEELDERMKKQGFTTAAFAVDEQILATVEIKGVATRARKATEVFDLDLRDSHASPPMIRTVSSAPREKRQPRMG